MELNAFYKSIVEQDPTSIVICNMEHEIVYMNPAAVRNYAKKGGAALIGKSLMGCHMPHSQAMIEKVCEWFKESEENNIRFLYHNPKDNKDLYMIALREDDGRLIGYYERHEFRTKETDKPCHM